MLDCGQQGGGQAQRVKPPSNRQPVCRLVWSAVSGLQMVQRWTSVTTSVSLSVTDSSTELEHICPAAWTTAPPCLLFIHRSLSPGTESVPEVDLSLTGRLTQRENSSVHAVASPEGFFTVCVYEEVNNGCARLLPWRWRPSRSAWTLNWRPPERRDGRRSSHRRSCWAAETEWKADNVLLVYSCQWVSITGAALTTTLWVRSYSQIHFRLKIPRNLTAHQVRLKELNYGHDMWFNDVLLNLKGEE